MATSKSKPLPKLGSLDELVAFFDTHDMGDYWDQMPEAKFDVDVKSRKHLVAIDKEIILKLNKIAKSKKVPSEKLINIWLREKIETAKRA
ncbi:MAG: CopG family antitoxin [Deltaproteobacteria bacterium]|nr:CopG family antitoxin [Deltaproteobacteria bacterium]MDZ4345126.1 CopG family antitoxin [Candidatus Binatia bacterium]